jgi:hypothetical protein
VEQAQTENGWNDPRDGSGELYGPFQPVPF